MAQTQRVVFLTDDYGERLDVAYAAFVKAKQDEEKGTAPARTAMEPDPVTQLAEEYQALASEAEAAGTVVVLTAIGRQRWRSLKREHPPRTEGHEDDIKGDRLSGVNTETVEDDLVYASVTEPKFDTRHDFDQWADSLSEGEWQTLVTTAWKLANGARFNPKALPSSPTLSDSSRSE